MEAIAIPDSNDESDLENAVVATFCNDTADARVPLAVALYAQGKSGKEVAAALGIERTTLWRLCQQYPIEQLAAAEAETRARPALLKLSANLEQAAEVICKATRGELDPEPVGEGGISYARAQLQLQGAKTTVGLLAKLLERAQQQGRPPPITVPSQAGTQQKSAADIIAAAREAHRSRALGKGGK